MKNCVMFLLIGLFWSHTSFASLTSAEATKVLNSIDLFCMDTWAEGAYEYQFHWITCDDMSCTVDFTMAKAISAHSPETNQSETTSKPTYTYTYQSPRLMRSWNVSCRILDMRTYGDLMEEDGLSEKFREQMSNCVFDLEEVFYR